MIRGAVRRERTRFLEEFGYSEEAFGGAKEDHGVSHSRCMCEDVVVVCKRIAGIECVLPVK